LLAVNWLQKQPACSAAHNRELGAGACSRIRYEAGQTGPKEYRLSGKSLLVRPLATDGNPS